MVLLEVGSLNGPTVQSTEIFPYMKKVTLNSGSSAPKPNALNAFLGSLCSYSTPYQERRTDRSLMDKHSPITDSFDDPDAWWRNANVSAKDTSETLSAKFALDEDIDDQ